MGCKGQEWTEHRTMRFCKKRIAVLLEAVRLLRKWKVIEKVRGAQDGKSYASSEVVPTVREHSGKEISSEQRDAAKERPVDGDDDDASRAFISMGGAEDDRR